MKHRPFPTPALTRWRAELTAGKRTATTFDALWRAACAEAWALDVADIPTLAEGFREDAKQIVRQAVEQHRKRGAA